ncbi:MOTHER of FT and TF 1-like [Chlorella sorokiniana]|uniref:MOTHER of FT and TF 1-like n=1 Tax=Chlorella sorokiniana TaxID=3076 RepID=A0A2P6TBX5_CHLSO|nr:MOTHER of FT and TF 1-like [Chlorella sorokiniana]|eukprot:PRW18387.1 MOTHER of FT and TF 1-like [Chlorella sorokiniana]
MGLEEAKIIPDLIDRVSPASAVELEVSFHGKAIKNGQLISPKDAAAAPKVHIRGGSEGGLFTLLASDPDPPDPANPVYKEWLHWIVTDVPSGGDASQGNEVVVWRGPSPPIGTHRYVFLLYQQPNQEPLQVSDPSGGDPSKRAKFNTRKFAAAHGLGDPVAVTWFNSHK